MNIRFTRYGNPHRPAPVREAVVVCGKNANYCALAHLKTMAVRLSMHAVRPANTNHIAVSFGFFGQNSQQPI